MPTRLLSRPPLALLLGLFAAGCAKDVAAPAPVAAIIVVQGADQSAQVGKALATPVILRAIDSTGNGIEGRNITLTIGSGGGSVTPTTSETDGAGEVIAAWTLGPNATSQSLIATAAGLEPVIVSASGLVPTQVVIVQGNNQTAKVGTALATQTVVRVLGPNNVPMVGIQVAVQVTAGGGSFTPQTAVTNATGEVSLRWTIGAVAGANTASIQVWTLDPVTISATGTP